MSREENVVKFYVLCNRLKNVIRTGWKDWHVNRQRIESVAEHIYGVQMLAIAMQSEYHYDIDIQKVIYMLAIHELEEILIGDLTQFQISRQEKAKMGHEAVENVLACLLDKDRIQDIILEFDERQTLEAKFAYYCDKLECDIQCKIYDEENCVDVKSTENQQNFHDKDIEAMLSQGKSWSDMWMTFGRKRYGYDENFKNVSKYVQENKILK